MSRVRPPEQPLDISTVSLRFGSHSIKHFAALLWDSLRDITAEDDGVRVGLRGVEERFYNVPNTNVRVAGKKDYALDKKSLDAEEFALVEVAERAEKVAFLRLLLEKGIHGTTVSDVLRITGAFDESHWSYSERNAGQRVVQMLHLTASGWKATSADSVAPGKATLFICTGVGCLICFPADRDDPVRTAVIDTEPEVRTDSRAASDIDAGSLSSGNLDAGYPDAAVIPTGPRARSSKRAVTARGVRAGRGRGRGGFKDRYPNGHLVPMPISLADLFDSQLRSSHGKVPDMVAEPTSVIESAPRAQDPAGTLKKIDIPVQMAHRRPDLPRSGFTRARSPLPSHSQYPYLAQHQLQILRHASPMVPTLPTLTQTPPPPQRPTYSIAQPHFPTPASLPANLRRASSAIPILPANSLEVKSSPARPTSRNSTLSATAPVFRAPKQLEKLTVPTLPSSESAKLSETTDAEKLRLFIERKAAWQKEIEPAVKGAALAETPNSEDNGVEQEDGMKEIVESVDERKSDVMKPGIGRVRTLKIVGDLKGKDENSTLEKDVANASSGVPSALRKARPSNSPAAVSDKVAVTAPSPVRIAASPLRSAKVSKTEEAQRTLGENDTDAPAESVASSMNTVKLSSRAKSPPPLPQRARKKPKPNKEIRARNKKRKEAQGPEVGRADGDTEAATSQQDGLAANTSELAQSDGSFKHAKKTSPALQLDDLASVAASAPCLTYVQSSISTRMPTASKSHAVRNMDVPDKADKRVDRAKLDSNPAGDAVPASVSDTQHSGKETSDLLSNVAKSEVIGVSPAMIRGVSASTKPPAPALEAQSLYPSTVEDTRYFNSAYRELGEHNRPIWQRWRNSLNSPATGERWTPGELADNSKAASEYRIAHGLFRDLLKSTPEFADAFDKQRLGQSQAVELAKGQSKVEKTAPAKSILSDVQTSGELFATAKNDLQRLAESERQSSLVLSSAETQKFRDSKSSAAVFKEAVSAFKRESIASPMRAPPAGQTLKLEDYFNRVTDKKAPAALSTGACGVDSTVKPASLAQTASKSTLVLPTIAAHQFWDPKSIPANLANAKRHAKTEAVDTKPPAASNPSAQYWEGQPKAPCFANGKRPGEEDLMHLHYIFKQRRVVAGNGTRDETQKETDGESPLPGHESQEPPTRLVSDARLSNSIPNASTSPNEKQKASGVDAKKSEDEGTLTGHELIAPHDDALSDAHLFHAMPLAIRSSFERQRASWAADTALDRIASTSGVWKALSKAKRTETPVTPVERASASTSTETSGASSFSDFMKAYPMMTKDRPRDTPKFQGPKSVSTKDHGKDPRNRADEILRKKHQQDSENRLRAGLGPVERFKRPSLKALPATEKPVVNPDSSSMAEAENRAALPSQTAQSKSSTAAYTSSLAVSKRSSRATGDSVLNAELRAHRAVSASFESHSVNAHQKGAVRTQSQTLSTTSREPHHDGSVLTAVEGRRTAIMQKGLAQLAAKYHKEIVAETPTEQTGNAVNAKEPTAVLDVRAQETSGKLQPKSRLRSVSSGLASPTVGKDGLSNTNDISEPVVSIATSAPPAKTTHAPQAAAAPSLVLVGSQDSELPFGSSREREPAGKVPAGLGIHRLAEPVGRSWWQAALQASSRVSGLWLTNAYDYEEGCVPASPKPRSNADEAVDQVSPFILGVLSWLLVLILLTVVAVMITMVLLVTPMQLEFFM